MAYRATFSVFLAISATPNLSHHSTPPVTWGISMIDTGENPRSAAAVTWAEDADRCAAYRPRLLCAMRTRIFAQQSSHMPNKRPDAASLKA